MAFAYNPNVGLFMTQGIICNDTVATCQGTSTGTDLVRRTIISSDYGETLTEVAEFKSDLGDDEFWQFSCAVFISDEEVRKESFIPLIGIL